MQAQVDIRDPQASEYPQWETGDERAVATSQCVAVATRPDVDGRVAIEVRRGPSDVPVGAAKAFEGELLLTGEMLVVGNFLASEAHPVSAGPGWHQLTVYVRPSDVPPSEIIVVIEDAASAVN